jgi:hypothetical protein
VANAVFLVDNQRYIRKDFSLRNNITKINELIVEPFYNLLCAGEEKKAKHIGVRILDTGDILQTLAGWTAIGYGESSLPLVRLPFGRKRNFRNKSTETHKGIQAMDEAFGELSIECNPRDSEGALYLLSAPAKEMNMDLIKELGEYLRGIAPGAVIRNGDYPRERGLIDIIVILSQLTDVEKVRHYYAKSAEAVEAIKRKKKATARKLDVTEEASKDIPTLL